MCRGNPQLVVVKEFFMAKTVEIFMAFWASDWFLVTDIHERKKGTESETTCEKCTSVLCLIGLVGSRVFLAMEKFFFLVCVRTARKKSF